MKQELSILIPTYNDACADIVRAVSAQASSVCGLKYEIIVGDDGSTLQHIINKNANIDVAHYRYLRLEQNRGRAAIRNSLADAAKYEWLLFIDGGHMVIEDKDYIAKYLFCNDDWQVVYGGYRMSPMPKTDAEACLRYKYEVANLRNSSAEERNKQPFNDFHTSNFLIHKSVFTHVRFNESMRKYGYEDVLFGRNLAKASITIHHINNPTTFCCREENAIFLRKTQEALLTLHEYGDMLEGYSALAKTACKLQRMCVAKPIAMLFKLTQKLLTRNLTGARPSLFVFKLYKLGYFLSIE